MKSLLAGAVLTLAIAGLYSAAKTARAVIVFVRHEPFLEEVSRFHQQTAQGVDDLYQAGESPEMISTYLRDRHDRLHELYRSRGKTLQGVD